MVRAKQWEVWLVPFDPSQGAEINKTRPAVVVSNDALNKLYQTVIVAPLTSTESQLPTHVLTNFNNRRGDIALDQVRCVYKGRLVKKIGIIPQDERQDIEDVLGLIFKSI